MNLIFKLFFWLFFVFTIYAIISGDIDYALFFSLGAFVSLYMIYERQIKNFIFSLKEIKK